MERKLAGVALVAVTCLQYALTQYNCYICKNNECDDYGDCLACETGQYGSMCEMPCQSNCKDGCHIKTGVCTMCHSGFYGETCTYRCDTRCEDDLCDQFDGSCMNGCVHMYWGSTCQRVCDSKCSATGCNFTTGYCNSCNPGFKGKYCDEDCHSTCSSKTGCDQWTGDCVDGCADNYYGSKDCGHACPTGCDSYCYQDTGKCRSCNAGFYGEYCILSCPTNCAIACTFVDGTCYDCKPGFYGKATGCVDACPVGCLDDICDSDTGQCSNCKEGFLGNNCEEEIELPSDNHPQISIRGSFKVFVGLNETAIYDVALAFLTDLENSKFAGYEETISHALENVCGDVIDLLAVPGDETIRFTLSISNTESVEALAKSLYNHTKEGKFLPDFHVDPRSIKLHNYSFEFLNFSPHLFLSLEESCNEDNCRFGGVCQPVDYDYMQCVCDIKCLEFSNPVCGSDGHLYENECQMKVKSCIDQENITIDLQKQCQDSKKPEEWVIGSFQILYGLTSTELENITTSVITDPDNNMFANFEDNIHSALDSICPTCKVTEVLSEFGEITVGFGWYIPTTESVETLAMSLYNDTKDGKFLPDFFVNPRSIKLDKYFFKYVDLPPGNYSSEASCSEINCKFEGHCEPDHEAKLHCVCNDYCPAFKNPVCGSDEHIYENECEMEKTSCETQTWIIAVRPDDCKAQDFKALGPENVVIGSFKILSGLDESMMNAIFVSMFTHPENNLFTHFENTVIVALNEVCASCKVMNVLTESGDLTVRFSWWIPSTESVQSLAHSLNDLTKHRQFLPDFHVEPKSIKLDQEFFEFEDIPAYIPVKYITTSFKIIGGLDFTEEFTDKSSSGYLEFSRAIDYWTLGFCMYKQEWCVVLNVTFAKGSVVAFTWTTPSGILDSIIHELHDTIATGKFTAESNFVIDSESVESFFPCKGNCRYGTCDDLDHCLCTSGYMGEYCTESCPVNCDGSCNSMNGNCTECIAGFHGPHCTYSCFPNCQDHICDQVNGDCSCKAGYYSADCFQRCSPFCKDKFCNQMTGECNCKEGYIGEHCERKLSVGALKVASGITWNDDFTVTNSNAYDELCAKISTWIESVCDICMVHESVFKLVKGSPSFSAIFTVSYPVEVQYAGEYAVVETPKIIFDSIYQAALNGTLTPSDITVDASAITFADHAAPQQQNTSEQYKTVPGTLKITAGIEFAPDLEDQTSLAYLELRAEIAERIQEACIKAGQPCVVDELNFSIGSIIVNYTVKMAAEQPLENTLYAVVEAFEDDKLCILETRTMKLGNQIYGKEDDRRRMGIFMIAVGVAACLIVAVNLSLCFRRFRKR